MPTPAHRTAPPAERLRLPQLRVLEILSARPAMERSKLRDACGFSSISGTLTTALNGIRPGSSSGKAHAGLTRLGLVEEVEVDVDGRSEKLIVLTEAGRAALEADPRAFRERGRRDSASSTNHRYAAAKDEAEAARDSGRGRVRR